MSTTNLISVLLEGWGALFCLFLFVAVTLEKIQSEELILKRGMQTLSIICLFNLLSESLAIIYHGVTTQAGYWIVRITNFSTFYLQYILGLIFFWYLIESVRLKKPDFTMRGRRFLFSLTVIYFIILVLNIPFRFLYTFDENNAYQRGEWFEITIVMSAIIVIFIIVLFIKTFHYMDKLQLISTICYFGSVIPCVVIQFMFYGLSLINVAFTFAIVIMFFSHQLHIMEKMYETQEELQAMKYGLLDSQIHPHFLFNSLAIISSLTRRDPDEAVEAIGDLSQFIRGLLNAKDKQGTCSIQEDLDIAKYYLSMEKRRFGDQLMIDIDDSELIESDIQFDVPYFTLQPLVENAVRHGIRKKLGTGHLWISFEIDDDYNAIIIEDDGVGFDPSIPPSDGRSHIGVKNVRKRLEMLCNGSMEIESVIGQGTTITLRIPHAEV